MKERFSYGRVFRSLAMLAGLAPVYTAAQLIVEPSASVPRNSGKVQNYWPARTANKDTRLLVPIAADMDKDGKADLCFASREDGRFECFLSATDTVMVLEYGPTWRKRMWPILANHFGTGPQIGGVDVEAIGTAAWYRFGEQPAMWGRGWEGWEPTMIPVLADYDGDGVDDMGAVHPGAGRQQWYVLGQVPFPKLVNAEFNPSNRFTAGDLDGDGKADFAWVNIETGVWQYISSRDGVQQTLPKLEGWTKYMYPLIADFDGDKVPDRAGVVSFPHTQPIGVPGGYKKPCGDLNNPCAPPQN